jgi:thioredoxin 1
MNFITLTPETQGRLAEWLADDGWIIACLCARWCDVCEAYRATFLQLAARHPQMRFAWIDIEDSAELVGHMDVENFPTLLMQRGDTVSFFGPLEPDLRIVEAVLKAQAGKTPEELQRESQSTPARRAWQLENNLRRL